MHSSVLSIASQAPDWVASATFPSWTIIDRPAARVVINRLSLTFEGIDTLEFAQVAQKTAIPTYTLGSRIQLQIDGLLVFSGVITDAHPRWSAEQNWSIGYRCQGLSYLALQVATTNSQTFAGEVVYDLPSNDPNYIAEYAGMSVGAILQDMLNRHMPYFNACGITGFTAADFTVSDLAIVPPSPIRFSGERVWNSLVQFLASWSPKYALYIQPSGVIRCVNLFGMPSSTLTLDTDPVSAPEISIDISECATRVIIRGAGIIEPAQLSLGDGTLAPAWDSTDQSNWTSTDFSQPQGGISDGTIVSGSLTSTGATLQPTSTTEDWPANYWSTNQGWITLALPAGTGLTQFEARHVTGSGASPGAGGAFTITWDLPLSSTGYTDYHLWCQPPGLSDVWRLYNITYSGAPAVTATNDFTNPAPTWVAQHLVLKSPIPMPWRAQGMAVDTSYPMAVVCWSNTGSPPYYEFPTTLEILPATGQIRFNQPVTSIFNGNIPNDLKVLVFYSRGTLESITPADNGTTPVYQGTAYSTYGLERTLVIDIPDWTYGGNFVTSQSATNLQALATQFLEVCQNIIYEGTITYHGLYSTPLSAFTGTTVGMSLNITGTGYTTGLDSAAIPVRGVQIDWIRDANGLLWETTLHLSSRRRPFSGDQFYIHPNYAPPVVGFDGPSESHALGGAGLGLSNFGSDAPTGGMDSGENA